MSLTSALVDADEGNGSGRDKATTSACPEDDDDDFTISVSFKSRRCGHLLASAKCVLLYLSLVIALLIASTLFLVGASAFRTRPHLVPPNRHLHWYLLLLTAALIAWLSFSITVLGRRQDNLGRITALGLAALILFLMDAILLCRLIVGFALAQGINGSLLQRLGHSEALHHCLLSVSRIVCFLLWMVFINGQLKQTKWTYLQVVRTVKQERKVQFSQIFSEIDS